MNGFNQQPGGPATSSAEESQLGNGYSAFALESIRIKADMLLDLVYYLESAAIEAEPQPTSPNGKRLFSMIYILEEMLKNVVHDLEEASGHIKVCDAIMAVSHVRDMKQELSELREKLRNAEDTDRADIKS